MQSSLSQKLLLKQGSGTFHDAPSWRVEMTCPQLSMFMEQAGHCICYHPAHCVLEAASSELRDSTLRQLSC